MPTISNFYGIRITMNYNDHDPPHFHAEYQEWEVIMDIRTGGIEGKMPRRAINLLWTWLDEHREELLINWDRARNRMPLLPVAPLE